MIPFRKYLHPAALFLSTLLFIVLTINGCQQQKTDPPEKITIAYTTNLNPVLIHIALVKGFFKEEGLEATPQPHAFGKVALQSVIDGKADIATVADTPIMFAVMAGRPITTLAVLQTSNRNAAIVARQDRGITRPSDLKGKKIGLTLGTTGHFFTDSFLQLHNIGRKQVKIIDMNPDKMAHALDIGEVDAVSIWNPHLTQIKKRLGSKGILFFDESLYTENFCLVARQKYAKKNPEAVKKVLRALIKAEIFVHEYPEESRRLVAGFLKVDKALLDEIWDIFMFRVALDQALLVDIEDQTRWAIKNRLTPNNVMPNYLDFIYLDGLEAVKPDAVRIIH
ncbi:nmt1/thi5 like domain protein [hydrocarbon metagenome]|uniref:Nmt1/thi5 like domain protein n=1 Tax=hydrocarbon metagenome TaxID=938273 RepID=A0A0W8FV09_9ZZZZ